MEARQLKDSTVDVPVIPGYTVTRIIGCGAFGQVWLAEERLTGLLRAVKVLPKTRPGLPYDPTRELAGVREYQQKAKDHACLIQVHHVGETGDCYYYVMELADDAGVETQRTAVHGPLTTPPLTAINDGARRAVASTDYRPLTLQLLIERDAPKPAARALDITAQVLRGLEHLHACGLIHRDVKPSNVLVVGGRIKLGDMGLVTTADRDVTQVGTPGYMPPDAKLDQTSDLYAAGIMLYEMITGLHRSRFPELPVFAPRSRRARRTLRAAIHIANKAAHPDRRQRYASADRFRYDLEKRRPGGRAALRSVVTVGILALAILATAVWGVWAAWRPENGWEPSRTVTEVHGDQSDPARKEAIFISYGDGEQRIATPSPKSNVCEPTTFAFRGGRPLVAVGFRYGPDKGKLLTFDGVAFRRTGVVTAIDRLAPYKPPPEAWDHQEYDRAFAIAALLGANVDGVPGDELIVSVIHDNGPTQWVVYTRGWQVLSEYWHYGHQGVVECRDLDGDSLPEIISWGYANKRGDPETTGKGKLFEPLYHCIMVLDPRRRGGPNAHWSMNEWMNRDVQPEDRPLKYGRLTYDVHAVVGPDGAAHDWEIKDVAVDPHRIGVFRVELRNGWLLELDANLRPHRFGPALGAPTTKRLERVPAPSEVWCRMVPDGMIGAKDLNSNGE